MVVGNSVYFGSTGWDAVLAEHHTGHENWSLPTGGPIKAGPAYYRRRSLLRQLRRQLLRASTPRADRHASGRRVPGGEFYSTPGGRVRARLRRQQLTAPPTRSSLAAERSPGVCTSAVTSTPDPPWPTPTGLGPTVYIGSYSGEASTRSTPRPAAPDWTPTSAARSPDRPPSSTTSSTSRPSTAPAATASTPVTGTKVFSFPDGSYTTAVANPGALFLMGRYVLYKLVPR